MWQPLQPTACLLFPCGCRAGGCCPVCVLPCVSCRVPMHASALLVACLSSALHRRTIRFKALGGCLPPFLEVSVKALELEQSLHVRDLPVPRGTRLAERSLDAEVVRCTTDVGKD